MISWSSSAVLECERQIRPYNFEWCCQVNEIQSAQAIDGYIPLLLGHGLGARLLLPVVPQNRSALKSISANRERGKESLFTRHLAKRNDDVDLSFLKIDLR